MSSEVDNHELYSLKWNDYVHNLQSVFKHLRDSEDFCDVTIACVENTPDNDEKHNVVCFKAHRIILAACSSFFQNILAGNMGSTPIVYLKDVKVHVFKNILNFVYNGEVQIANTDLPEFLSVASSLKIKGLVRSGDVKVPPPPPPPPEVPATPPAEKTVASPPTPPPPQTESYYGGSDEEVEKYYEEEFADRENVKSPFGNRIRATDPRPCPKCGKIYRSAHTLRTHLEDKHTICPGYRCVLCGTVAKSRNSLHSHMSRQHRGISTKDLPVIPMPAPFDPDLANQLLAKIGKNTDGDTHSPVASSTTSSSQVKRSGSPAPGTGSAILDTYLQLIAENSSAMFAAAAAAAAAAAQGKDGVAPAQPPPAKKQRKEDEEDIVDE